MPTSIPTPGTLYTVSAPSGAGKTTLVNALVNSFDDVCVSVSHTTRAMRPSEVNGENYHFIDHDTFSGMIENGEFVEHAKVFNNYYGTSQGQMEELLQSGMDVILEIDWQGAAQVRKLIPNAIGVFILPPSRECLHERLNSRAQDDASIINARMAEAKSELSHYVDAQYIIVNDDFDTALSDFRALVLAQRLSFTKQQQKHEQLLQSLLS